MADLATELNEILSEHAQRNGVPGAAAGVLVNGECITASYGVTNVEHPLDVDADTLFQVASITKTFTSAAVMLLVEGGRVSLEDPVSKHLPDLSRRTLIDFDAISIERLLSHQAGFDGDHLITSKAEALDDLRGARALFAPGDGFSYNNAAFSIAGAMIEAVSGQGYESFVRERLLRPLGMATACFRADDAITHRVAVSHAVLGDSRFVLRGFGFMPGFELGPVDRAAGGLLASVEHLLEWCRFQTNGATADGKVLLSRESLDRLHTPLAPVDQTLDVGMDWFVRHTNGVATIEHPGSTLGTESDLVVVPAPEIGVVSLTHAVNGAAVNQAVRRWALQRFAGITERDPEPAPSLVIDPARFVGTYLHGFAQVALVNGDAPGTVVLTHSPRDDQRWTLPIALPPVTFGFFAEDHAVSLDATGPALVVRFGFGDDRRADWLLAALRRSPRIC